MRKRIISLFLAVTMLISLAPAVFAAVNSFADVSKSDWFYAPVQWAVENGITSGLSETEFGPNVTCTRGQVVTFLWAAANKPEPTVTGNPFVDVTEADWFLKPVLWAVENGITSGLTSDTFGPNEPCTRSQVVTFLWAAANKPEPAVSDNPFVDVTEADWFLKPVLWAVENKITSGLTPDTFGPEAQCTRAQIVTFLYAASKVDGTEPTPEVTPEATPSPTPEVTPVPADDEGFAIYEVECTGKTVTVVFSAPSRCTLQVYLLDESGENVKTRVDKKIYDTSNLKRMEVDLDIWKMPKYYQVRAQLVDNYDDELLCKPMYDREHTQVYEKFDTLMESDFPADRVLDVAEKNDGNFAVIRDDVIRLEQTNESNLLTSRNEGVCVFAQPDAALMAAQAGDRLMLRDTDGQYAGALIESVQLLSDGTMEIREAADTTLTDFYSVIKIDVNLEGHSANENGAVQLAASGKSSSGSSSDDDKMYLGDITFGPAISNSLELPFGSFEHTTTAGGKLELRLGFEDWDGYVEFTMLAGVKSDIALNIGPCKNIRPSLEALEIAEFTLVGLKDIADVPLTISLDYEVDCETGLETTLQAESVIGYIYNSTDGGQQVEYKNVSAGELQLYGSAKIEIGLLLSAAAELLDGKGKIGLGAELGAIIEGEAKAFTAPLPGTDEYHACELCVDGALGGYFELDFTIKFEINEKIKGDLLDLDLIRFDWRIGKFYGSLFNDAQSIHGGIPTFKWGECPNKKYKITIKTCKNGINAPGHPVTVTSDAWGNQGGGSSAYELYLYPGKYWAEANIGIQNDRESFTVEKSEMTVVLNVMNPELSGYVTDDKTGESIEGATINVYNGDNLIGTTTSLSSGYYHVTVPADTYKVVCSAEYYESETVPDVKLAKNDTLNFVLEKNEKTGTVSGTVTDADTKEPLSGVTISTVLPDSSTHSTSTNGKGKYSLELPVEQDYVLKFMKKSYEDSSLSVRVDDESTIDGNMSLKYRADQLIIRADYWGNNVKGAKIEITLYDENYNQVPNSTQYLETGEDGTVTVDLPRGHYGIYATYDGCYTSITADVPDDTEVVLDFWRYIHIH